MRIKETQSNGQAAWQLAYSAFGETAPTTAAKRFTDASSVPTTGTTTIAAVEFNLRFPGQYADKESGLSYNYFRSYNPTTGRFSQPDPIGLAGGWNRFGYVNANPLSYVDPNGLNPLMGAFGGAEIGSVFGPVGTVVGGVIGAGVGAAIGWNVVGPMLQSDSSARPPGTIDAIARSKEWGRRNDVKNPVDIFHDIKRGNRGRPGSRAAENCSVDPKTGDIYDGQGEHISNLGEGH